MARARVVGNGLGAEGKQGKLKGGIAERRARVRRLVKGPGLEDASKHW